MMDKEKLKLLPKYEEYIVYVNKMIIASPKCCRISIGDELKKSMYNSLYQIYRLMHLDDKYRLNICNELDALFSYQRSVIRTMYDLRYIDIKKKMNCIKHLGEIGRILGGYVKSLGVKYAKKI